MFEASQKRTCWPQIVCDERDMSLPYWRQRAIQQFCGYHQWKDSWVGGKDEHQLIIYQINPSVFSAYSPFNKEIPSLLVMWVLSWCGPAVPQTQHQVLVLMFENMYLHIHRLAKLHHCLTVTRRIKRRVWGICKLKIKKIKEKIYRSLK